MALAALALPLAVVAQTATQKTTWQQSRDARRALVGPGCVVNRLLNGITVGSGVSNLQNLVDEDLNNAATIPTVASLSLGYQELVSIKNLDFYSRVSRAGFIIEGDATSLLDVNLNLGDNFQIWLYKDGELADTDAKAKIPVTASKGTGGLNFSLISVGGKDVCFELEAQPAKGNGLYLPVFDEMRLVQTGVEVGALKSVKIRHAYAGTTQQYNITSSGSGSMSAYAQNVLGVPVENITYSAAYNGLVVKDELPSLTDGNLNDNGGTVIANVPVKVTTSATDANGNTIETFKKGMSVGFVYTRTTILDLGIGSGIKLTLYDKDGNKVGEVSSGVDILQIGTGGIKKGVMMMTAPADFSSVEIDFYGVNISLGVTELNYAFVRLPADPASHRCPINANSNFNACDCDNVFTLHSNPDLNVSWSQKSGPSATIEGDKVTLTTMGVYTFEATATDCTHNPKCSETVDITYGDLFVNGGAYNPADNGEVRLVNTRGSEKYALTNQTSGELLKISDGITNPEALLTPTYRDYAFTKFKVALAENDVLAGVKINDNSDLASLNGKARKVGFVVETKASVLKADVLDVLNIELYNNGTSVYREGVKHWNAISVDLVGSGDMQMLEYTIDVPADVNFDEIVLHKSGILTADLTQFNIYYAFVRDASVERSYLGTYIPITNQRTNASIDHANTNCFAIANVGNGINNIANLIDYDDNFETGMDFPMGVSLGEAKVRVNVGRTVNKNQHLVIVMDKVKYGLGVNLGDALLVRTFFNGEEKQSVKNWHVIGADIIGDGGKTYYELVTTEPFDQVEISQIKTLSVANGFKIYGMAICHDSNGDGTVDGFDIEPCKQELILDEDVTLTENRTFKDARMVFRRTINRNSADQYTWNSLILPVSLTRAQTEEAFGTQAVIGRLNRVEDNWIYFVENASGAIDKDFPYIIKVSREPDVQKAGEYKTIKDGILTGPIYLADGINYSQPSQNTFTVDCDNDVRNITHTGTYNTKAEVPVGEYMLNKGDMVHTAVVHKVKGYRSWLHTEAMTKPGTPDSTTPSQPLKLRVVSFDGSTTDINTIDEGARHNVSGTYNLNGQRVAHSQRGTALPKGVYIINGKKTVLF